MKTPFVWLITASSVVALGCADGGARDAKGAGGVAGSGAIGGNAASGGTTGGTTGGTGGSAGAGAGAGATGGSSGIAGVGAGGGASGSGGAGATSGGSGGNAGTAATAGAGNGSGGAGNTSGAGGAAGTAGTGGGGAAGAAAGASGAGGGGVGGNGGSGGASNTFHVFLLFGQSNMAGYARATNADKTEDPRIQVLGFDNCQATGRVSDQWDTAVPPLHECGPGAVGPGDWFSKTLIEKLPSGDTIGLVPCALSGQAVSVFSKGTDKYTWMINRVKKAQQMGGIVEGMLFHQGESDCGSSAWPGKVAELVSDLRADLELADVPFLAGELPHSSACGTHNPLVNQLPDMIANAHVISAQGLNLDPADTQWNMHFGHDDTVELGKRYEAKIAELMGL
jgi:hypothetical protein